jgi:DNA (cytosine-5)-methyltransferase 1
VLDAQYFGVPQRRRRVFIVGCSGDSGRTPEEILDLRESRSRYLEASKSEGQDTSRKITESVRSNTVGALTVSDLLKGQLSHESIQNNLLQVASTVVTSSSFGGYQEGVGTLRSSGGDLGGGSENLVVQ